MFSLDQRAHRDGRRHAISQLDSLSKFRPLLSIPFTPKPSSHYLPSLSLHDKKTLSSSSDPVSTLSKTSESLQSQESEPKSKDQTRDHQTRARVFTEQELNLTAGINSGIAGAPINDLRAKCIHALVADYLCRRDENSLGAKIWSMLVSRDVPVTGHERCLQQCRGDKDPEGWRYMSKKNKSKLHVSRQNWHMYNRGEADRAAKKNKSK